MSIFRRRKSMWQRVAGRVASGAFKPAVKTGTAALTGVAALIATSAAVSSLRRKRES